ncbi:MAG: hypothetical protein QME94_03720 [Anaerolineae bacterium]|nr:hypothetical protein [Anaerolineae bacterium]
MSTDDLREGSFYDDEGEHPIARVDYRLNRHVGTDGFEVVTGEFYLREEFCPLHTGMAQLVPAAGEPWLVRVLRISRPQGHGEFEIIGPPGAEL